MKKITLLLALSILGITVSLSPVFAASVFQFSPSNFNVEAGQKFSVNIILDPQGTKNYTSKLEINFPADIIKVDSFAFGNSWMPVTSAGYDVTNNTSGTLIKTAGFSGGVSSPVNFGVVSFTTLKEGAAAIAVNGNSFVLGASGQNLLNGSAATQASITVKASHVTPNTTTSVATLSSQKQPSVTEITQEESTAAPITQKSSLLASVANSILSQGAGKRWLMALLLLTAVGWGWYGINYFNRNKNFNKKRIGKRKFK